MTHDQTIDELHRAMHQLETHTVFSKVHSRQHLRVFMEWHVFAVWDFMSLIKRLQHCLTCVQIPWTPPADAAAARIVNEIVLGEESDENGSGAHESHFDLYLKAMKEVGASTVAIENVVSQVAAKVPVDEALRHARVDSAIAKFVNATISTAREAQLPQVLGSFFYGRENVIPAMFKRLLSVWSIEPRTVPTLTYYLQRHIEVDAGEHGPAAERIINRVIRGDALKRQLMLDAALDAVRHRLLLWDGLARRLADVQPA
jgi:hypothetical protein